MTEDPDRQRAGNASQQPPCRATTKSGRPCRSFASGDAGLCSLHDPERAAAIRAKGGQAAGKIRALRGQRSKLSTPAELLTFTAGVIHRTLECELPTDVARVVLYGVSIQRQLVEVSELEKRLARLEEQLTTQHGKRGQWRT